MAAAVLTTIATAALRSTRPHATPSIATTTFSDGDHASIVGPMDAFETLDRSRVEFRRVLAGVTHEHWELATPCEEWDVRELVNHVFGGNVRYTMLLHGAGADEMAA